METLIDDKELGVIRVRTHPRATRYTLRIADGKLVATMPPCGDEKRLKAFINENRDKLTGMLQKCTAGNKILDESTNKQFTTFRLHIFRTNRENFYMKLDNGILHIACPEKTDFKSEEVQEILKSLLARALRHEAKRVLPERLQALARKYNFTYRQVRINKSKTRWGSCSSQKDINLSLSLMYLPWHLIDYVLLHELCHTVEMNHSEQFWSLMDKVTAKRARSLRKELKSYHT